MIKLSTVDIMQPSFSIANWFILLSYIFIISTLGSLFYRKKSSSSEFFLGGRRMKAIPVGISLVAADMSAITYMGSPAWSYNHNFEIIWASWTYLLVAPVVMFVFMPFYSRFKFYTAYEYLEQRFDVRTRVLGSAIFLLIRGSHVAIVIYAPSLILSLITGIPLVGCILLMGVCTTLYTTLGGIKAVIWTDVMQFSILLSGIIAIAWLSKSHVPGGWHTVWVVGQHQGSFKLFNFSTDPTQLTSFWATTIGGGFLVLSTLGTDQAYLQRYFATSSLKDSQHSVLLDALIIAPLAVLLYSLGPILHAFYQFHPDALHSLPSLDAILPYFVLTQVKGWLSGFIIASIFAASMAVMSAGLNALTTATTVDFYKRLFRPQSSDEETVRVGRVGTVLWGALATFGALFAGHLGPIINAFNIINGFLGGPILGIFLLGMLSKRVHATGTLVGAAAGFLAVSVVALETHVSFFYYSMIGTIITFGCGWLFSFFRPGIPCQTGTEVEHANQTDMTSRSQSEIGL